jgi:hypothetical protein
VGGLFNLETISFFFIHLFICALVGPFLSPTTRPKESIYFVVQKLFNFMWSHLSILSLSCFAVGVLLRNFLPLSIASRVLPALSYTNFKVLSHIFRSLINFELIPVQGDRHGSSFSFLQADNHFSQQHSLKRLSILHCSFWHLCQK